MHLTRRQLLGHSTAIPLSTLSPLARLMPLAGLGLAACSTVETKSVQARLLGKSITVISTIGTTLRLTWRGTTVFNNEQGEAFVPDWGFKEQLETRTVELLKASGRFSSVQRATITSTRREEALKELKELKTPTDHVLLISGAPSGDTIWATKEGFYGLGIAQRSIGHFSRAAGLEYIGRCPAYGIEITAAGQQADEDGVVPGPGRLRLVLGFDRDDKSAKQRRFLHGPVLGQISEQAVVAGVRYAMPVWKEHLREKFLGFTWECVRRPGQKRATPRKVRISTESLSVKQYSEYIDKVLAYAATDLGVAFDLDPIEREEVRYVRPKRVKQPEAETA
jgi:hypothetical protein